MRVPGAGTASVASLAVLWLLGLPWTWSAAAAFGVYVGGGGWRFLRIVCKTARRDLLLVITLNRVESTRELAQCLETLLLSQKARAWVTIKLNF